MKELFEKIYVEIDNILKDKYLERDSLKEQKKKFSKEKNREKVKELNEKLNTINSYIARVSKVQVERTLAKNCIPKNSLKDKTLYYGHSGRCGDLMVWFSDKEQFGYWRSKWSHEFTDYVEHFEQDKGFVIFFPYKEADLTPENIELKNNIIKDHER